MSQALYLNRPDGAAIYHEVHGTGLPVLFLNGLIAPLRLWHERVLPSLAGIKAHLLAYRGQELSRYPGPFTLDDLLGDVLGVLDAAGDRQAVVVGDAFGASLALLLASRHPERVRALAVISAAAVPDPHLRLRVHAWHRLTHQPDLTLLFDGVAPDLFSASFLRAQGQHLQAICAHWLEGKTAAGMHDLFSASLQHRGKVDLQQLKVPMLILQAGLDRVIPPMHGEALRSALPHARYVALPGVGHAVLEEAPDLVAKHLANWLGSLPA